jgi:hypothetical protein
MTSPRSWNRREFAVTQNGYFTILKSTGWFSAAPLPGGFRYLTGKPKGAASPRMPENTAEKPAATSDPGSIGVSKQKPPGHAGGRQATIQLQTIDSRTPGRHLMRLALIVIAATALTWIGLWCTAHP